MRETLRTRSSVSPHEDVFPPRTVVAMAVTFLWCFVVLSCMWGAAMLSKQSFLPGPAAPRSTAPGSDLVSEQAHELAFSLPHLSRRLGRSPLASWSTLGGGDPALTLRFPDGSRLRAAGFAPRDAALCSGLAHVAPSELRVASLRLEGSDTVRIDVLAGSRRFVLHASRLQATPGPSGG